MSGSFLTVGVAAAILALAFAAGAVVARRRPLRLAGNLVVAALFLTLAALAGTLLVATRGYRALSREELAATVHVEPIGPTRFQADFRFPDGRSEAFVLRGDQLYVDAHILKWKPLVNVLGVHTAYELDRVAGRYTDLKAEQDSVRTVFSLARERPLDLFALRQRWAFLAPLVDAEYGSGTFHRLDRPGTFEILVSTTGLMIRPVERLEVAPAAFPDRGRR